MVLGIKSSDTRRKEERRRKYIRNESENGKSNRRTSKFYDTREARKLYSKVRETKKEFKPRVNICKTKDGSIICDQNEVLARWNEHFDDLLNKNNQKYAVAEDGNTRSVEGPIAEEMNPLHAQKTGESY